MIGSVAIFFEYPQCALKMSDAITGFKLLRVFAWDCFEWKKLSFGGMCHCSSYRHGTDVLFAHECITACNKNGSCSGTQAQWPHLHITLGQ